MVKNSKPPLTRLCLLCSLFALAVAFSADLRLQAEGICDSASIAVARSGSQDPSNWSKLQKAFAKRLRRELRTRISNTLNGLQRETKKTAPLDIFTEDEFADLTKQVWETAEEKIRTAVTTQKDDIHLLSEITPTPERTKQTAASGARVAAEILNSVPIDEFVYDILYRNSDLRLSSHNPSEFSQRLMLLLERRIRMRFRYMRPTESLSRDEVRNLMMPMIATLETQLAKNLPDVELKQPSKIIARVIEAHGISNLNWRELWPELLELQNGLDPSLHREFDLFAGWIVDASRKRAKDQKDSIYEQLQEILPLVFELDQNPQISRSSELPHARKRILLIGMLSFLDYWTPRDLHQARQRLGGNFELAMRSLPHLTAKISNYYTNNLKARRGTPSDKNGARQFVEAQLESILESVEATRFSADEIEALSELQTAMRIYGSMKTSPFELNLAELENGNVFDALKDKLSEADLTRFDSIEKSLHDWLDARSSMLITSAKEIAATRQTLLAQAEAIVEKALLRERQKEPNSKTSTFKKHVLEEVSSIPLTDLEVEALPEKWQLPTRQQTNDIEQSGYWRRSVLAGYLSRVQKEVAPGKNILAWLNEPANDALARLISANLSAELATSFSFQDSLRSIWSLYRWSTPFIKNSKTEDIASHKIAHLKTLSTLLSAKSHLSTGSRQVFDRYAAEASNHIWRRLSQIQYISSEDIKRIETPIIARAGALFALKIDETSKLIEKRRRQKLEPWKRSHERENTLGSFKRAWPISGAERNWLHTDLNDKGQSISDEIFNRLVSNLFGKHGRGSLRWLIHSDQASVVLGSSEALRAERLREMVDVTLEGIAAYYPLDPSIEESKRNRAVYFFAEQVGRRIQTRIQVEQRATQTRVKTFGPSKVGASSWESNQIDRRSKDPAQLGIEAHLLDPEVFAFALSHPWLFSTEELILVRTLDLILEYNEEGSASLKSELPERMRARFAGAQAQLEMLSAIVKEAKNTNSATAMRNFSAIALAYKTNFRGSPQILLQEAHSLLESYPRSHLKPLLNWLIDNPDMSQQNQSPEVRLILSSWSRRLSNLERKPLLGNRFRRVSPGDSHRIGIAKGAKIILRSSRAKVDELHAEHFRHLARRIRMKNGQYARLSKAIGEYVESHYIPESEWILFEAILVGTRGKDFYELLSPNAQRSFSNKARHFLKQLVEYLNTEHHFNLEVPQDAWWISK